MKVRYTEAALAEIDQIFSYIAARNRSAAITVRARIEQTVAALGEAPEMAQKSDEPSVRRMVVGSYPYILFYTVNLGEVVILHVRHGARLPPWKDD